MPDSPLPPPPAAPQGSRFSTVAAVMMILLGAGFLLLLPGRIGVAMVVGGLFFSGLFGFHYLVWGRWLGKVLREAEEDEEDES